MGTKVPVGGVCFFPALKGGASQKTLLIGSTEIYQPVSQSAVADQFGRPRNYGAEKERRPIGSSLQKQRIIVMLNSGLSGGQT